MKKRVALGFSLPHKLRAHV